MKMYIAAVAITLSVGCATTLSQRAMSVKVTDGASVSACEVVGEVSGSSSWGGASGGTGVENSKMEALNEAGELGATHVVWKSMYSVIGSSVDGVAYRCSENVSQRTSN